MRFHIKSRIWFTLLLICMLCLPLRAGAAETCTVTFYSYDGSKTLLSRTVTAGSVATLPTYTSADAGYQCIGWSTTWNASTAQYAFGQKVTITSNLDLYEVRKKVGTVQLTIHQSSGAVYKTVDVTLGGTYTLPGMKNPSGGTMLGWSLTAGQTTAPLYDSRQTIKVDKSMDLYPVVFKNASEKNIKASRLKRIKDLKNYDRVYFIGDSRTVNMRDVLKAEGGSALLKKITMIAQGGAKLDWFKETGRVRLLNEVAKYADKRKAVIFNLGVNDLTDAEEYIYYYGLLADALRASNCSLFIMSVNPINVAMMTSAAGRTEERLRSFNAALKQKLCTGQNAAFTYINTYGYLLKNGYSFNLLQGGEETGKDDGLHFGIRTNKKIYQYCMNFLAR